jgi:hypothetical protein
MSRPILGSEASLLFACTVGRKSTSRSELSAFLWNSFAKCSVWNRYAMRPEISSEKRLCRCGQTCTRALDTAIREIDEKTDLNISLALLERSLHRRVTTLTFAIKTQAVPNGDSIASANIVNSGRGKGWGGGVGEPSGAVSFKIWELICEILLLSICVRR